MLDTEHLAGNVRDHEPFGGAAGSIDGMPVIIALLLPASGGMHG